MASKEDHLLLKAALEGFSTFEERQKRKTAAQRRPNNYQGNDQSSAPAINSKEAAERYGGMLIEPVITSDEAARRYGGTVIVAAIKSDQAAKRFGGVLITDRRKGQVSGA